MATPETHALCSASSSERWLHCTAAPLYEQNFPAGTTNYAEEGRLAHAICETMGRQKFSEILSVEDYRKALEEFKANPIYDPEMESTAEFYVNYLTEKAMSYDEMPAVFFEIQVNFSTYVPHGFGTCDCIMIGGDTLQITDYKHGKGVKVDAINNSQMRLYALGALGFFKMVYGDSIKYVTMAIVQPRISEDVAEETITVTELLEWGESIKEKAQQAYTGIGATFCPGDWCKFCRGKASCKARAAKYSAFEDFKDCIPQTAEPKKPTDNPCLSNAEIADLLIRAADLVDWYKDLQEYAQQAILDGQTVPGWKVVAGKSNRAFTDEEQVKNVLINDLGITDIYKPQEMKTLTAIEKMLGKAQFSDYLGKYVEKPVGKPTLVPESDKRPSYSSAVADFSGVVSNGA